MVCDSYRGSSGRLGHSRLGDSVPSQCGPFLLWRQQGTRHSWPQQGRPCLPPPQAQGWAWQCPHFLGTRGACFLLERPPVRGLSLPFPQLYEASQLGTWPASFSSLWQPRGQGLPRVTGEGTETWRGEVILQNGILGTQGCPHGQGSTAPPVSHLSTHLGSQHGLGNVSVRPFWGSLFTLLQPGPP